MATRVRSFVVLFVVVCIAGFAAAPAADAATAPPPPPSKFTATPLQPIGSDAGNKAPSSRLARTDESVIARTDRTRVSVLVKLDYDAIASYRGGVAGIAPTSPSVTGRALDTNNVSSGAYPNFVATQEQSFVRALAAAVPDARVEQSLRVVYGGVAVSLPANEARLLVKIRGVVAVQNDGLRQLLTDS